MAGDDNQLELTIVARVDDAEQSLGSLRRQATDLALAMEKLKGEIEDAGGATDEQQADLDRLSREYDEAIAKAGAYTAAQDDVRKATAAASASIDGQVRPLTSVGDAADRVGGKLGKLTGIIAAVGTTFLAAYEGTVKFQKKVDEWTDGGLQRFIQKLLAAHPLIAGLARLMGVDLKDAIEPAILATDKLGTSLEGQAKFAAQAAESTKRETEALKESTPAKEKAAVATVALTEKTKAAVTESDRLTSSLLKQAEAAARGAQSELQNLEQRRQELESKGPLSAEESEELLSLTGKQVQAQNDLADANSKATAAQLQQAAAQKQLANASRDALDAGADYLSQLIERDKALDEQDGFNKQAIAVKRLADGTLELSNVTDQSTVALTRTKDGFDLASTGAANFDNVIAGSSDSLHEFGDEAGKTTEKVDDSKQSLEEWGDAGAKAIRALREEIAMLKTDMADLNGLVREYKAELATLA